MKPGVAPGPPFVAMRAGDIAFARMEKVNAELVALTYGALVAQLFKEGKSPDEVTCKLDAIGFNMGIRMVDEFLAKQALSGCSSFREAMDVVAKVAVKMFLGVDCELIETTGGVLLNFPENPLNDFVELPLNMVFSYSSIYCGMIRGAMEQLHMRVTATFVKDTLRGDDTNSIQVMMEGLIRPESD